MNGEVEDLKRALWISIAGFTVLLFTAAFDLNAWPMRELASAVWHMSGKEIFFIFARYGTILVMLFWAGRPSRFAQWTVFLSWPVVSALLWRIFASDLHITWYDEPNGVSALFWLIGSMAVPVTVLLAIRVLRPPRQGADLGFESRLRYLTGLSVLFLTVPISAVQLTATLHPLTYDLYALHWDHAAGLNITYPILEFAKLWPVIAQILFMVYNVAPPICFMALALRHLRHRPPYVASALLTWVILSVCALIAYHAFPIAGPKYIYGIDGLSQALSHAAELPLKIIDVPIAPRNGMPSMHFGWILAACVLWWRSGTTWWSRAIFIVLTTLTAASTLSMGEHYMMDLIVAVPFVLAVIALCTTSIPWSAVARRWAVLVGFGAWAGWIVALRTSIHWLVANPWACWLMILATVIVVALQSYWMCKFPALVNVSKDEIVKPIIDARPVLLERRLGLMFFVSGFAALVYQVLFAKQLALVFGSTSTATLTVLATFLGGMAIGSMLGSRLAPKTNRPLVLYAMIETMIAVYCVATPFLFNSIQHVYVALASGQAPDASMLLVLRVVLGAAVLLVPTVLMGATLPVLAQALGGQSQRIGLNVAWLYFANTGGAAAGALLTSYAVIPLLGASRTTLVAAVLNVLVALGTFELSQRWVATSTTPSTADKKAVEMLVNLPKRAAAAALLALCIGGVLSLGLEVVYVHMLSIVAGNSVYAFGLMLATFLLGLAGGGETARRLLSKPDSDRVRLLAWALLGLAASVAAGVWWWNDIPEYFSSFAQYPAAKSFASREAIRGIVCALLMIPPTLFIGAAYAFGMDIATAAGRAKPIAMLGFGAALNTFGNITGVLLFGFCLLPLFGGLISTQVIAFGALTLAALVLVITATRVIWRDIALFAGAAGIVVISLGAQLNYDVLSSGANVYFSPQNWGRVIEHAESIDGGLTTVTLQNPPEEPIKTLLTNGKFQGTDSTKGEMQAQIGFAMASLLHQGHRERALVIGYGTGVTSRVFHEAGFRHLDIAELSRDVVRVADTDFAKVNHRVSSAPGVQLHVTDGRNLLLLSPKQSEYDVVSIEITSIWFAGAASLYNREFYSLARSRMAQDGVLQQWVQLHHLAPTDILSVVASLRAEFRYVSLYVIGSQGILIATNSAERKSPNVDAIRKLENTADLREVRGILDRPIAAIASDRLLDDAGIDRFIEAVGLDGSRWWSTDDNLRLEYSTPKANVNDAAQSYQNNLKLLTHFR
ncbi:MAG: phosphatase PAP2 family protein [Burkholderiaceae bacterium]|nr:phosphatase PAP2 family protein [Burkholderiaceae bacterium]